jgi:IS5 family transposase
MQWPRRQREDQERRGFRRLDRQEKAHEDTHASVHDSREMDNILDPNNDSDDLWADSAYRSDEQEARQKEKGCASHIRERATRNRPLTPEQKAANPRRSRVRVEHIFGHIETAMNGCKALRLDRRSKQNYRRRQTRVPSVRFYPLAPCASTPCCRCQSVCGN